MSGARELRVRETAGQASPSVRLIDARSLELPDDTALRKHVRALSETDGSAFVSRSYSFPLAVIASHTAEVGVDIECVEPCNEKFIDSIRTSAELTLGWPQSDPDRFFTSLWSSKEALSKALGNALSYDPRWLDGPGTWPDGCAGGWRAQPLDVGERHVGWLCWRAAPS